MGGLQQAADEDDLKDAVAEVRRRTAGIHASVDRDRLPMWTVFGPGTRDHPGLHVARLWLTLPSPEPTDVVVRAATLDQLRSLLPQTLTCLTRQEGDDPNIVETWF